MPRRASASRKKPSVPKSDLTYPDARRFKTKGAFHRAEQATQYRIEKDMRRRARKRGS